MYLTFIVLFDGRASAFKLEREISLSHSLPIFLSPSLFFPLIDHITQGVVADVSSTYVLTTYQKLKIIPICDIIISKIDVGHSFSNFVVIFRARKTAGRIMIVRRSCII